MAQSEEDTTTKSKFEVVPVPNFESDIPHHLLNKLPPDQKYLLETASITKQQGAWLCERVHYVNRAVVDVDIRTQRNDRWIALSKSKWAFAAWIFTVAVPVFLEYLLFGKKGGK
jgi:hypothetical protein